MKQEHIENWCMRALGGQLSVKQQHQFESWITTSDDFKRVYADMQMVWQAAEPQPSVEIPNVENAWANLEHRLGLDLEATDRSVKPAWTRRLNNWLHARYLKPAFGTALALTALFIGYISVLRSPSETVWQTVVTQNRQTSQLTLDDGSRVTLNAGSQLRFPKTFGNDVREVYLEGEAFFEVKSDGRPFVVLTDQAKTTVLGTRFIVRSREDKTKVMVAEGRVRVESADQSEDVILSKGQMSEVQLASNPTEPMSIDIDVATGWLNGRIHFERTPITDVLYELERHYDVRIEWEEDELVDATITGAFHDTSIEVVLSSICLSIDANFDRVGDTYIITK